MFDETYSLSDDFEQNSRDKIYIWISEPTNGAKHLVEGNHIVYFQRMDGRRGLFREKVR